MPAGSFVKAFDNIACFMAYFPYLLQMERKEALIRWNRIVIVDVSETPQNSRWDVYIYILIFLKER